jgi:hypothetical protein
MKKYLFSINVYTSSYFNTMINMRLTAKLLGNYVLNLKNTFLIFDVSNNAFRFFFFRTFLTKN